MTWNRFTKAAVAVVGALVVLLQSGITADGISGQEWLQIGVEAFGAFSIWLTANYVAGSVFDRYAKVITAAGFAALTALAGYVVDEHLSTSELWNVIIAAVAAVGVGYLANDPSTRVASSIPPPH